MKFYKLIDQLNKCFSKDGEIREPEITKLLSDIDSSKLDGNYKSEIIKIIESFKDKDTVTDYGPMSEMANQYKSQINPKIYKALLVATKIAHILENQNGIPEEHAIKLAVMFNDYKKAIKYIKNQANRTVSTDRSDKNTKAQDTDEQIVHNACLFILPHAQANWDSWRKLITPDALINKTTKELLSFTKEIEEITTTSIQEVARTSSIKKDDKSKPSIDEKKRRQDLAKIITSEYSARTKLNTEQEAQLIKKLKSNLNKIESDFTKLDKKHGELDAQGERKHAELNLALLNARVALSKAVEEKKLSELTIDEVKCHFFRYKGETSEAFKYLINRGINTDNYNKFEKLDKTNAGMNVPDLYIDGADIGHPDYYMRKLYVQEDKTDAAIAACLGKLTDCCQSISGEVGEPCAIHGLTSPDGGFYVVFKKTEKKSSNPFDHDSVIAQSWSWRGSSGELVFDSVERKSYGDNEIIKTFYSEAARRFIHDDIYSKFDISTVLVGQGGGTPRNLGVNLNITATPKDYSSYRDSSRQRIISSRYTPYLDYLNNPTDQAAKARSTQMLGDELGKNIPIHKNRFLSILINHIVHEIMRNNGENLQSNYDNLINKYFDVTMFSQETGKKLEDYINANIKLYQEMSTYPPDCNKLIELIKQGGNAYFQKNPGHSIINITCKDENFPNFLSLLEKEIGTNDIIKIIDMPSSDEDTVLHILTDSSDNNLDSLKAILGLFDGNNDKKLDEVTKGKSGAIGANTPIGYASAYNPKMFKVILDSFGDDIDKKIAAVTKEDSRGNSCVRYAAQCDSPEPLKIILDLICHNNEQVLAALTNTNKYSEMPLIALAQKPDTLKYVIDLFANDTDKLITAMTKENIGPPRVSSALWHSGFNPKSLKMILDLYGSDAKKKIAALTKEGSNGTTVMSSVTQNSESLKLVLDLFDNHDEKITAVTKENKYGRSPIMDAKDAESLNLLLDLFGDDNDKKIAIVLKNDSHGSSILLNSYSNHQILKLILDIIDDDEYIIFLLTSTMAPYSDYSILEACAKYNDQSLNVIFDSLSVDGLNKIASLPYLSSDKIQQQIKTALDKKPNTPNLTSSSDQNRNDEDIAEESKAVRNVVSYRPSRYIDSTQKEDAKPKEPSSPKK